jgi:hypothetical protein
MAPHVRAAGPDAVVAALQPLVLMFGARDFGKGEAGEALQRAWIKLYVDALAALPAETIAYAVKEWLAHGAPFFPKPSELVKLAEPKAIELRAMAYKLKMIAERWDADAPQKSTVEDQIRVQRGFEELAGMLASKSFPGPQRVRTAVG